MQNEKQPGVSGKNKNGKSWFNTDKYHEQIDQMDKVGSQKLQDKTDLDNQGEQLSSNDLEEEVFQALKRGATVDISDVTVIVQDGVVILEGTAESEKESRAIENIAANIRGVISVKNNLEIPY